jgi:hypothetical protein
MAPRWQVAIDVDHATNRNRMRAETAHLQLLWTVNAPQVTITAVLHVLGAKADLLLLEPRGVLAREPFPDVLAAAHYASELHHRFLAKGWTDAPSDGALALAALVP